MINTYLRAVHQRFTEFGGFDAVEAADLPELQGAFPDGLLMRTEAGLITLVGPVSPAGDADLTAGRDALVAVAAALATREAAEVLAVLLLVSDRPLTRAAYEQVQGLKLCQGRVRVVPWLVDLTRGRLFEHSGPPFGIDPDLVLLASPESEAEPEPGTGPTAAPQPPQPRPWLTMGLLALLVAIWLAMTVQGGALDATESDMELMHRWGAILRPELWEDGEFWRLFTTNFLHFGLVHLAMNSLALWSLGRAVELLFGWGRMLVIYLFAGVAGAVASAILGVPMGASAGASGAIFGLLGAVIWYRLSSPLGTRIAWRPLLTTLGLNLALGLSLYQVIDNWAHLGGLVGGALSAAAVGVPAVAGMETPRYYAGRTVHWLASAVLVLAGLLAVSGALPVPGRGQDLARAKVLLYDKDRPAEAEALLLELVRREPDQLLLRAFLIDAYVEQGKCAEAVAEARRTDFRDLTRESREYLVRRVNTCQ